MPRFLNPFPQFLKLQNGALQPNTEGYLTFYVNGTSTLASVYTDATLTTPATNPQELDSEGRMTQNVFLSTAVYRVKLTDSNGAVIWDKSDFSIADTTDIDTLIAELEALIETASNDLFSNNYVPNPAMQIDLLDTAGTPINLTTSYVANVTGYLCSVLSNVSAGTAAQNTTQIGQSGYSIKYSGVSCTSAGQPALQTRILSADAISLSNKTLTISLVVKHNVGSAVNYTISTAVANVADDFSAVTSTGLSSTTSVASGTATTISLTADFADVTNGLQIIVKAVPNQALTTKDFYWSDVQCLVSGAVLGFKVPLYNYEYNQYRKQYFGESEAEYTAYQRVNSVIPIDDTVPQSTEGTEILSVARAATNADNVMVITVCVNGLPSVTAASFALFANSTCIRAGIFAHASVYGSTSATEVYAPASTSSVTYSVRVGVDPAGYVDINGDFAGNRLFGGVCKCSLLVAEYGAA